MVKIIIIKILKTKILGGLRNNKDLLNFIFIIYLKIHNKSN